MPPYTTDTRETGGRGQIVAVVVFLLLALVLNYLPSAQQQQVAGVLRASVLRPFVATQEGLARAKTRASNVERLQEVVDSLVAESTAHTTLREENRRLRGLLSLSRRLDADYRPAVVVRPGTIGSESMFVLDIGTRAGVRPNAPVIDRRGLVGLVRQVREDVAIGMDWTHPEFRASAMTTDGTTYGMVESRRGEFREEDRLLLDGTPFQTTLDAGTVVVTSGLGGIFPRGVPIGRVDELAESDAGWRKSYWLRPFVEPASVTHALVAIGTGAEALAAAVAPDSVDDEDPPGTTGRGRPVTDVSAAWPQDSIMDEGEIARLQSQRDDSLEALGDSVAFLRAILQAESRQDSLRRAVLGDTTSLPTPAPPLPPDTVAEPVPDTAAAGGGVGSDTLPPAGPPDTGVPSRVPQGGVAGPGGRPGLEPIG